MLQQRKKDYLQRLIEEFFSKFYELVNETEKIGDNEKKKLLKEGFDFYTKYFETRQDDPAEELIKKIQDVGLLENYAKLLLIKNQIVDIKDPAQLYVAFDIVKYLGETDNTFSWDRTVLREDLLRLLDEQ